MNLVTIGLLLVEEDMKDCLLRPLFCLFFLVGMETVASDISLILSLTLFK
jgi:hypothetical protein